MYFHLDLREVLNLGPPDLALLQQKMKEYSKDHAPARVDPNAPHAGEWIRSQQFGGGKHKVDGLVLRHDLEGDCLVRLCVSLEVLGAAAEVLVHEYAAATAMSPEATESMLRRIEAYARNKRMQNMRRGRPLT